MSLEPPLRQPPPSPGPGPGHAHGHRRHGGLRLPLFAVALAIVAAPAIWRLTEPPAPPAPETTVNPAALQERIVLMDDEMADLRRRLDALERQDRIARGEESYDPNAAAPGASLGGFENLMLLSDRREMNRDLSPLRLEMLASALGAPSDDLTDTCAPPQAGSRLAELLAVEDVGPFRARLIAPALESVARVFARVKEDYPELHGMLRSYGGFCARLIRGSVDGISRHAFGVALDVSVGGGIDQMGDGKTQFGLIVLSDYFYSEGWIWGAAFGREDSMHFEVSAELFDRWAADGLLDPDAPRAAKGEP